VGSFIWQASLALAMNSSRPLLQPPRILAQKLQSTVCAMNRATCVEFCVTSIHAKRRRTERERGRERERSERREAERKKAGAGATWSPAVASRRTPTLLQTYKQAERQREREGQAGRPATPLECFQSSSFLPRCCCCRALQLAGGVQLD
jgi:hypothetical protein